MKECKDIREEIDQATFADQHNDRVREHLRGCVDCTKFEAEQRALQGMMAGLGTIPAPPDFDFRLRARLAREKSAAGNGSGFASFLNFSRVPRPIAIAALLLVLAVAGVALKNWMSAGRNNESTVAGTPAPIVPKTVKTTPEPSNVQPPVTLATGPNIVDRGGRVGTTHGNIGSRGLASGGRKVTARATRDEALGTAAVLTSAQSDIGNPIVEVPLNDEGLKISIDDGRGSPRMISLPRFSFGSQRLTGHSFVPVSATKGVW